MVQPHDAIEPVAQHPRAMTMSTVRLAGFAGLLVAAALVGGTVIGSAAAANVPRSIEPQANASAPSPEAPSATRVAEYCADFRRAFAANLGVDESALAPAAKAAAVTTIDAAVAAGHMTKTTGDRLKARIEKAAADGCALLTGRPGVGRLSAPGAQALAIAEVGLGAAASALGIAPAQLGADLRAGKTLKEVAAARGVRYDTVSAAVVAAVKTDLDAAVAAGTIKQPRAERILERLQRNLADGRLGNPRPVAPSRPSASAAPATGS
jgi:ribosomal protein S20